MQTIDILLPTYNRLTSLIMTLSGLAAQNWSALRVVISDQSDEPAENSPVVQALWRVIEARGGAIAYYHRPPAYGIAEQRDFLVQQAQAASMLCLDDDIFLEPWVIERLHNVLEEQRCGFVGAFPGGLSFRDDVRPEQQKIEYWEGPVQPEVIEPGGKAWERWQLHRAANLYHIGLSLPPGENHIYKVAWVGACVLYDRAKVLEAGGFSFWRRLPRYHEGEEVLLQNLLMRRWGGCAIVPSGTYHAQLPTTVRNTAGQAEGNALDLLPELLRR